MNVLQFLFRNSYKNDGLIFGPPNVPNCEPMCVSGCWYGPTKIKTVIIGQEFRVKIEIHPSLALITPNSELKHRCSTIPTKTTPSIPFQSTGFKKGFKTQQ